MPNIGYGSAKSTKHMLPNGFRKVLVHNIKVRANQNQKTLTSRINYKAPNKMYALTRVVIYGRKMFIRLATG